MECKNLLDRVQGTGLISAIDLAEDSQEWVMNESQGTSGHNIEGVCRV